MALPVAGEIDAWLVAHGEAGDALHLLTVAHAAVVFSPRCLLGVAEQVDARDVVMVANLGATQAREELFRPIGAGLAVAVGLRVIDPLHFKAGMQGVPA